MKKPVAKLKLNLNHETIKALVNDDLTRVRGGLYDCPDITRIASGCTVP